MKLRRGAMLFGAAISGIGVVVAVAMLGIGDMGDSIVWGISICTLAACVGAFLVSSPEPDGPYFDDRRWLRRAIRIPLVPTLGGEMLLLISTVNRSPPFGGDAEGVTMVAGFLSAVLAMQLVSWLLASLARRLPSRRLKIVGRLAGLSVLFVYGLAFLIEVVARVRMPHGAAPILLSSMFLAPGVHAIVWARSVGRAADRTVRSS